MAYFMYVSLQDDDKVVVLEMDPNTGRLERKAEAPIAGAPSALAISPDRQTLYIGHRNSNELSSHRINQTTGELTQVGKTRARSWTPLHCHQPFRDLRPPKSKIAFA
jgi:6-phosphogluconolactonase (cycloisomerase 2 family)